MRAEQPPVFESDQFGFEANFDVGAAFMGAVSDTVLNAELALDEKIRRVEQIVSEASSETYRQFINFRQFVGHIEMACNHDPGLDQANQASEIITSLRAGHELLDGHSHEHANDDDEEEDEYEMSKHESAPGKLSKGMLAYLIELINKRQNCQKTLKKRLMTQPAPVKSKHLVY